MKSKKVPRKSTSTGEIRSAAEGEDNRSSPNQAEAPQWIYDNITEVSKHAKHMLAIFVVVVAYGAVTVASVSDRQIALNEAATLPFINAKVSFTAFSIIFPVIVLFSFLVLQLYLFRLRGLVVDLRTRFGSIPPRRLYPWLINIADDSEVGAIGVLQRLVVNVTLWWYSPAVLLFCVASVIRGHDPIVSYGAWLVTTGYISLVYWFSIRLSCGESTFLPPMASGYVRATRILFLAVFGATSLALLIIIPISHKGWPLRIGHAQWEVSLRALFVLNLSHEMLVQQPVHDYPNLHWGNFRDAHLEGADLSSAVLKRADLRGAHLQHANISNAVFEDAALDGADLRNAGSSLDMTDIMAIMQRFRGAALMIPTQECTFEGASLVGADLSHAKLAWANFRRTRLDSAVLRGAYLRCADISRSYLQHTCFEDAIMEKANIDTMVFSAKPSFRGACLNYARISSPNMNGADFSRATFVDATIQGGLLYTTKTGLAGSQLASADVRDVGLNATVRDELLILRPDLAEHLQ